MSKLVTWQTETRNANETLVRAKATESAGIYPDAVHDAIMSGELYLKSMLRKMGIFIESGPNNDKHHNLKRLWDKVKGNCGLSTGAIAALDDVFINRGSGKGTLQYIDRTVSPTSHVDSPDLPATRYSTAGATPSDYYDSAYALEKISLAETVKNELTPYL